MRLCGVCGKVRSLVRLLSHVCISAQPARGVAEVGARFSGTTACAKVVAIRAVPPSTVNLGCSNFFAPARPPFLKRALLTGCSQGAEVFRQADRKPATFGKDHRPFKLNGIYVIVNRMPLAIWCFGLGKELFIRQLTRRSLAGVSVALVEKPCGVSGGGARLCVEHCLEMPEKFVKWRTRDCFI